MNRHFPSPSPPRRSGYAWFSMFLLVLVWPILLTGLFTGLLVLTDLFDPMKYVVVAGILIAYLAYRGVADCSLPDVFVERLAVGYIWVPVYVVLAFAVCFLFCFMNPYPLLLGAVYGYFQARRVAISSFSPDRPSSDYEELGVIQGSDFVQVVNPAASTEFFKARMKDAGMTDDR